MIKGKTFKDYDTTIKLLRSVTETYKEGIQSPDVDKYGIGFSRRDTHSVFATWVHFQNYRGRHGNRWCNSFVYLGDLKIVEDAFIEWLDKNYQMVFNGMADMLEADCDMARKIRIEELRKELGEISFDTE
jgi:hypothetical protein